MANGNMQLRNAMDAFPLFTRHSCRSVETVVITTTYNSLHNNYNRNGSASFTSMRHGFINKMEGLYNSDARRDVSGKIGLMSQEF